MAPFCQQGDYSPLPNSFARHTSRAYVPTCIEAAHELDTNQQTLWWSQGMQQLESQFSDLFGIAFLRHAENMRGNSDLNNWNNYWPNGHDACHRQYK